MYKINVGLGLIYLIFVTSCNKKHMTQISTKTPVAKKIATTFENHGDIRIDDYHWMRLTDAQKTAKNPDAHTQEVLDYLNEENAFFEAEMQHTKAFQDDLFEELKGRIKEDDSSVPYKKNGYFYITKFEIGKQYPIYTRKKETLEAEEELLFDVNTMAEGHDYYTIGGLSISPDNTKAIYGVDTISRRQYILYVKDLVTGEVLEEKIEQDRCKKI